MLKPLSRLGLTIVFLAVSALGATSAEPALPDIFSSGMVLQRDMPIPVWGSAGDSTEVTVKLGETSATATAAGGKWRVELPSRPASAEALRLTVSFSSGPDIVIDDVLVGEVWLCAGQSNMAQTINKKAPRALADMPQVRQFSRQRGKKSKLPPTWKPAVGEGISDMSVTAVYFAENLHRELDVPVGLILTAVSGTPIEEWTPRATLETDAATKARIAEAAKRETRQQVNAMRKQLRENPGQEGDPELQNLALLTRPGRLYAQHIAPTVPYGIRGVIWYQGEANSKVPANAQLYGKYLALLVAGLREAYGQPELPFYAVQLPSIEDQLKEGQKPRVYEMVREQQRRTVQATPHAGLAVSLDVNEGLHPRSKNIMGDRLAKLALAQTYHRPGEGAFSGPLLTGVTFQDGRAVCTFEHAEGGLELKDTGESLFELAGPDGVFHPATAKVEGDTLVVESPAVSEAAGVRYAFRPFMPRVSLYGASGLPAAPFVHPSMD
ncbi:MAG: sialate O-acetylesterase [Verrucomicrobiota bacterium]